MKAREGLYTTLTRRLTASDSSPNLMPRYIERALLTAARRSEVLREVEGSGNPSRNPVACPEGRKRLGHA